VQESNSLANFEAEFVYSIPLPLLDRDREKKAEILLRTYMNPLPVRTSFLPEQINSYSSLATERAACARGGQKDAIAYGAITISIRSMQVRVRTRCQCFFLNSSITIHRHPLLANMVTGQHMPAANLISRHAYAADPNGLFRYTSPST
jgi:hypothetical protein